MQILAVLAGLVLGALAAVVWHFVSRRSKTGPLFTALGRAVRSMLSDDGRFLQEYAALLVQVGSFVFWNVLALGGALAPLLATLTVFRPEFEGHPWLVIVAYCVVSMAGILWLRAREKRLASSNQQGGLSISDAQFFLLQLAQGAPWAMRHGETIETRRLRRRLDQVEIDRPVFITGLARSGTTMMLELVAQVPGVATHRYRDFPFLMTPYFWNRFLDVFGSRQKAVQRPHQDGIQITSQSPEAYEEPIWHLFFPSVHRLPGSHVLGEKDRNDAFDEVFVNHLKKMLLIRHGNRYASKGNYNVTRLEYLGSLFPDARFVVPVRHPIAHVASLVRQHALFCDYARRDDRVPQYLMAAGHFEFGPQRVPISIDDAAEQTLAAWQAGGEFAGYAMQWAAVYGHLLDLLEKSPSLAERVMILRYEDICDQPADSMAKVLKHVALEKQGKALMDNLGHIKRSAGHQQIGEDIIQTIWKTNQEVASQYDYEQDGF